jgi:NAD(P)-dependent dehydrogenase (short-subunit alcohol dehydrogenase family)
MARVAGRVAVVTGASRGIGRAVALALAREGATVVVASRKADGVQAVTAEIEAAGGKALPRPLHVGQTDAIPAWWDEVQNEVGLPDILVNNAGTNPYFGPMLTAEWAAWDKTFDVNLKGPFEMARQLAHRHVRERIGQPASIVSVASILGTNAAPLQGIYGMTKAALMSMTRTLAAELGETGIRVNAIAPGIVDTRLASALTHDPVVRERIVDHTALRRIAQPEEIAGLVLYLASGESSFVTGQTWLIDGGYTIL